MKGFATGRQVDARARDGIKNQAALFKFTDYFTQRIMVEQALKEAVYERLLPVHVKVKDLHMGRVSINEKVREKQLDARVQFEVNDEAEFQRAAQLERDATNLQVAEIDLQVWSCLARFPDMLRCLPKILWRREW